MSDENDSRGLFPRIASQLHARIDVFGYSSY
jgi:hypothetical protein